MNLPDDIGKVGASKMFVRRTSQSMQKVPEPSPTIQFERPGFKNLVSG